jgi:perosamine synthetase
MEPIAFAKPYMGAEEEAAAAAVIRSGWIVGGPRLAEFEGRFAALCGAQHAVGVSSWTTGAFLALHALGVGPGDEVIVPSLTFIASVNVVAHTGATPVFVEIDPQTWNIDPSCVEQLITPRTRAIMPVDQIGLPADVDAIRRIASRRGLHLIEDAACSFASRNQGRPIGSLADVTIFSLHARKVVSTGEGGVIVANDGALAERLRRLRHQGMSLSDHDRHSARSSVFEDYPEIGFNFRITDIQAAIGLAQLDRLPDILARRKAIAERYSACLEKHPLFRPPLVPEGVEHNWQSYMIELRPGSGLDRNAVMDWLYDRGIPTRRGVMASHLETPYAAMKAALPHTEAAARNTLQLPMHPGLTCAQQDHVIARLEELAVLRAV